MGVTVERVGNDLLHRLAAGGSFIITDELGTELFRVSAATDAVTIAKQAIDPDALAVVATLDNLTATAAELNVLDVSALPVARVATTDGTTTGTITATGLISFVTVTSDNANKIIVLPAPVPGTIVIIDVGATGFELRSSAPATVSINGGAEAAAESAIAANSTVIAICLTVTAWKAFYLDADSDLAKVEVAAA